jgi:hypothetical protein
MLIFFIQLKWLENEYVRKEESTGLLKEKKKEVKGDVLKEIDPAEFEQAVYTTFEIDISDLYYRVNGGDKSSLTIVRFLLACPDVPHKAGLP